MAPSPDRSEATLAGLCRGLRASDRTAFEQVFRLLRADLLRYAARLIGESQAAHDVVQDVFLDLWRLRETLDPDRPLRPYVYRMARNRALRYLRDARTHARKEAELYAEQTAGGSSPPDPGAAIDAARLGQQLQRWLAELPERQREALVLSRFHQFSHREIAAIMDISPRTVNNHIMRALEHLQRCVQAFEPALWNP